MLAGAAEPDESEASSRESVELFCYGIGDPVELLVWLAGVDRSAEDPESGNRGDPGGVDAGDLAPMDSLGEALLLWSDAVGWVDASDTLIVPSV